MINLADLLDDEMAALVQRVQRSLVVLHNESHGIGAGLIWSRDGLILTNYHVVAYAPRHHWQFRAPHSRTGETHLRASLPDGNLLPCQVIAQEPEIDLALLRIEARELPTALVADSRSLRVGQLVLAIGHPWGQRNVVTAGIISGFSRAQVHGRRNEIDILLSDAHLAPGNSGGPLVNAVGAVVGINTMIVGGDQGIAIPSHVVSSFVEEALSHAGQFARKGDERSHKHDRSQSRAEPFA
jgi:serine protease Do